MQLFKNDKFFCSLLPSLGLLFGHMFMWSNNVHMFEKTALAISFLIVVFISLLLFLVNYQLIPKILHKLVNKNFYNMTYYAIIACLFIFLTWSMINYIEILYKNKIWAPIFAFVIFIILSKKLCKIIIFFFALMLLFSTINLVKNSINDTVGRDVYINFPAIEFKKKPNIYIFWQESYQSFDILKLVFNIDNKEFIKFLEKNSFVIDNNNYSSGMETLQSMSQFYSLGKLDNYKIVGRLDAGTATRDIIGGNENNIVFKILKNNGYRTILLTCNSAYYFHKQYRYMDDTDAAINDKLAYIRPLIEINYWKYIIESKIGEKNIFNSKDTAEYTGDLFNRVRTAMNKAKIMDKPYIIAFKGGAEHTPLNYTWKERDSWIKSNFYQELVAKADEENQRIISHILQEDPKALIIMLGDHGPWTYRAFPEFGSNEPYASCEKLGVQVQDLLDDRYKVLFAYRLPNGDTYDLSQGMYMNNINVFTHIFAYLAQDPGILKYRTRSESAYGNAKVVEGRLLPPGSRLLPDRPEMQ